MKTIFDQSTRDEMIRRIVCLGADSKAIWGSMTVFQMLRHCTLWEETILQNKTHPRPLIGRLIGPMILRSVLKDDSPLRRNSPTIPAFRIRENTGDVETEKTRWIALIGDYGRYALPDHSFIHSFFGRMTREQIGYLVYKHGHHHLSQFGC